MLIQILQKVISPLLHTEQDTPIPGTSNTTATTSEAE